MPTLEPLYPPALTLGELGGYFTALLSSEVRTAFDAAIGRLRACGLRRCTAHHRRNRDDHRHLPQHLATRGRALARGDARRQATDYQPVTRERSEWARTIPAVKYLRARDARAKLGRAVDAAFEGCDAFVLPTLPIVAPLLGAADVTMDDDDRGPFPSARRCCGSPNSSISPDIRRSHCQFRRRECRLDFRSWDDETRQPELLASSRNMTNLYE